MKKAKFNKSQHEKRRRRKLLFGVLGAGALTLPGAGRAMLAATPGQTEGPFYPLDKHRFKDTDNDLVLIEDEAREAGGSVLRLGGVVSGVDNTPLADALVEIWQCDASGRYLHAADRGDKDPYFQGYGRTLTDENGRYSFRTIRPVPYTGRTPHIHFKISDGSGRELLTTQMYVEGEPGNTRDGIYRRLSPQQREALTVTLAGDGADYTARFDLVTRA